MTVDEVDDDKYYHVKVLRSIKFGPRTLNPYQDHTIIGSIIKQLPDDAIEITSTVE